MSANAPSPSSRQEEVRAQEPSMEEILASIRRIIADDEGAPPRRRPSEESEKRATAHVGYASPPLLRRDTPAAEVAASAEIRPLRIAARDGEPAEPAVEYDEPALRADASYDDRTAAAETHVAYAEPAAPLMSADAASSIAQHFETLATTMMINESGILREYAQELLRPMLKQWLDDNLPVIVDRLVRAEIERVARGGRR